VKPSHGGRRRAVARNLLNSAFHVDNVIVIREWDSDRFHQRVLELEAGGYQARRESYRILAEMSPETGKITHLYSIEMVRANLETA
jgi:hypothetical protein